MAVTMLEKTFLQQGLKKISYTVAGPFQHCQRLIFILPKYREDSQEIKGGQAIVCKVATIQTYNIFFESAKSFPEPGAGLSAMAVAGLAQ